MGRNGQYEVDGYWLDGHPNRRGGSVITVVGATVMQYCGYIKGIPTEDWGLSNRPVVWNHVPGFSPVLAVCSNDTDITWIVFKGGRLFKLPTGRFVMSSGSFLKSVSTSTLDKLYDLPETIQDVMGLQALRPSAAVCKVMTVPDSNCVRIVTPDEHVPTGFHEILIYDMGQEEWPKVPLSEIGCLRLDLPKDLFSFVGRYQLELEQMRKECRDRFSSVTSGTCPTCEKCIQVNIGKHVALYHLDLAQLWRCPVGWCPVWKGTSQDCVDHMCRAHDTALSVKAGNQARWFPPWIITREQWHSMSRPSVSGIAIDTFLFSRIGTPLFHRYRVFDRFGSNNAFRKPYMQKLFTSLRESIRRSHRRRAKEIAVSMSRKYTGKKTNAATDTTLTRPETQRTVVSKITTRDTGRSLIPTANGQPWSSVHSSNSRAREEDTVQALMDLSLPRFARLEDGALPKTKLWTITEKPPSSPVSARDGNRSHTPSPCFQLDDLSSVSSTGNTSTNDSKMDTARSITPVGSIVFSSEEDVPLSSGQEDRRKVQRREPCRNDQPGPTEVPEYVPEPRERPVDLPIYIPTPRDRPVTEPTMGVKPVGALRYDPMLRAWPVDDRIFEPKAYLRPVSRL